MWLLPELTAPNAQFKPYFCGEGSNQVHRTEVQAGSASLCLSPGSANLTGELGANKRFPRTTRPTRGITNRSAMRSAISTSCILGRDVFGLWFVVHRVRIDMVCEEVVSPATPFFFPSQVTGKGEIPSRLAVIVLLIGLPCYSTVPPTCKRVGSCAMAKAETG